MGKLIIDETDGSKRVVILAKDRTTIGRHPDNDICLEDLAVSSRHAIVHSNGQDALLEDLGSTNGTLVNGRQISRYTLLPGDSIAIGRNRIVYASLELTIDAGSGSPPLPKPRLPLGKLVVTSGSGVGREMELKRPLTTVGRPGQLVVAITRRLDGYFIADAGGPVVNPKPRVNGKEIGYAAHKLIHNDLVEVAGTTMRFLVL